jgi:hypothetical protein
VLCYVFHCSPAERPTAAWNNVPLPEREIGEWDGPMRLWWQEGADVIAGLVPAEHDGLYLLVNRVGDVILSIGANQGPDSPPIGSPVTPMGGLSTHRHPSIVPRARR